MDIGQFLSEKPWLIEERSFDSSRMNVRETLFTLGNGYAGMRGIYEEIPAGTLAGTYIAGVYDATMSQVTELVNAPNPFPLKVMSAGEKLDVTGMKVKRHYRALDLRRGLLARQTIFVDRHNHAFDYRSVRFVSAADPHTGAMLVAVTPLDAAAVLSVQAAVDTAVTNAGVLSEGRKTHFWVAAVDDAPDGAYYEVETFTSKIRMAFATSVRLRSAGRSRAASGSSFQIKVKKGETATIVKFFSMYTSNDVKVSRLKSAARESLDEAVKRGFDASLKRHQEEWERMWQDADVVIEGDDESQKGLRFNIYHLLISGNAFNERVSIGARTLSGEAYRGHIFWDAEIYMFPFFLYTRPAVARNLLRYRYHQLDQARANARAAGYGGALFGWETADTGEDVTPRWFKALDWSITKVETSIEHHLAADIAYALDQYHHASGDDECMASWGAEILFETARFWASRTTKRKGEEVYDIRDVIGPDEFHVHVDNNAYTNFMARWNLEAAYWRYQYLKANSPADHRALASKIGLTDAEVDRWLRTSHGIPMPTAGKGGIIEQFDGYFRKKRVRIAGWDESFMPVFPNGLSVTELNRTQLIKQADVLLLFHLFPDAFDAKTIRRCFRYYDRRTAHKSSLSHAVQALAALRARYPVRAYQYFHHAVLADLEDKHGNSVDGIHGGSLGAAWQAVVHGFGGMRIRGGRLWFEPRLPVHWSALSFKVRWRGAALAVSIGQTSVRIRLESARRGETVDVGVFDSSFALSRGESLEIRRAQTEGQKYDLCKTICEG